MQSQEANSIIIVGGGSAGWMTALYLNRLYNHSKKTIDITVIESKDIGTIGVGEATVPSIRAFFQVLGLNENELLTASEGTLKAGIMFRNWMKPYKGKTHEYLHPFDQQQLGRSLDISSLWILNKRYEIERYDEGVSLSSHLVKELHAPKAFNSNSYQGVVPYAYHLDATLMGRYMRKKATTDGVTHIETTVDQVNIESGVIKSVSTDKGTFSSDFFIDCTGFRGLLIGKLKDDKDNWQPYGDALLCNKAFALQIEYPEDNTPKPYTVATALSNGWAWEIDLVHRRGTGYVYDGRRLSKEGAEQELRDYLGNNFKEIKSQHLDMKIGCLKEFWISNCLAVGLSGGFIEPLESTGLHLINLSVRLFGTHFSSNNPPQSIRDSYNKRLNGIYEDLRQFIVLHYCLNNRDDTEFWKEAAETAKFCPGLEEKLEIWKHKICEYFDLSDDNSTLFTDDNYRFILYGMQHNPDLQLKFDKQESQIVFDQVKQYGQAAIKNTLSHTDYLNRIRKPSSKGGITVKVPKKN